MWPWCYLLLAEILKFSTFSQAGTSRCAAKRSFCFRPDVRMGWGMGCSAKFAVMRRVCLPPRPRNMTQDHWVTAQFFLLIPRAISKYIVQSSQFRYARDAIRLRVSWRTWQLSRISLVNLVDDLEQLPGQIQDVLSPLTERSPCAHT